jgi:RNA polymerase sigma-70 factor (ECF subfamily)
MTTAVSTETRLDEIFRANQKFLWGLCYRLTGDAADAEDIVQETFVRALKKPPARQDEPWRPWLVQVAMNLGRDLLRRRRRRQYDGPWLPSPIDTGNESTPPSFEPVDDAGNPLARYDMLESVSYAFLIALEPLTPLQRGVLLLRDVFDYSVRETAEALSISEANVKTTHTRARRAMQAYDRSRELPTAGLQERTRLAIERFLDCLSNHDVAGAEAMLAKDARQLNDGGGEFIAARAPILGPRKIVTFNLKVLSKLDERARHRWGMFNGLPALLLETGLTDPNYAPRGVTLFRINQEGLIESLYTVVATRKLQCLMDDALEQS